jgi:hypothetical protein
MATALEVGSAARTRDDRKRRMSQTDRLLAGTMQFKRPSPQPSPLKGEGAVERCGREMASPFGDRLGKSDKPSSPLGGED